MSEILDYKKLGKKILSALKALREKYPEREIIQVCGPITTGGLGSIEENINLFNSTIEELNKKRIHCF